MLLKLLLTLTLCSLALSYRSHHDVRKNAVRDNAPQDIASDMNIDRATWTQHGTPRMLFGHLGRVASLNHSDVLAFFRSSRLSNMFHLSGSEFLEFRHSHSFKDVVTTFRFDQYIHDLPVLGGEIAIHVTPSSLEVHGVSGNLLSSSTVTPPSAAVELTADVMVVLETKYDHVGLKVATHPVLQYMIDEEDNGRLCFYMRVLSRKSSSLTGAKTSDSSVLEPYDVYVDAVTHELLMDIPVWQKALYRQVFDTQNTKVLPGNLVRKEGQPAVTDPNANEAYDNAAKCYNYYLNLYGRDSWDNKGSPLNSSVHYSVKYDNAFWNGEQMVYGDGDDIIFADFTGDLSVICHELSHAVTQSSSKLRYWYESGALNEAFSDIMGSSAVVYTSDPVLDRPDPATSWIIGPNCTLQNLNPTGCPDCPLGLRFMNNPTLDGSSRDYYPERYTGLEDSRGVHWNSGIANLAYVLTVQGGVHPQQKTKVYVGPIGLTHAQQIYYLGFTQYMTATSAFADARTATLQATQALYPNNTPYYDSVGNAWSAVGVESTPPTQPKSKGDNKRHGRRMKH